ncbi:MAG TPA: PAS domain S-box protein [Bryobacteraceae bacterium]|jgi:PAS domain S-box-containing protein|nr:PAS domain S-box protein [Bryobacteraceae bacterium]
MTQSEVEGIQLLVSGTGDGHQYTRTILDALPVAVYTTDAQGRLTYFNPAAVTLSGRVPQLGSDQWCVTWRIYDENGTLVPHDRCPMAMLLQNIAVEPGGEYQAERPDGTRFWFMPYPALLRDADGKVTGGINVLVDTTERRNRELRAHEQFRAIIETTPECVKIVAPNGDLLFMNPSGLEMIGATRPDDVTGRSVYDLIMPEHREFYREFNERICRGEKGTLEFDIVGFAGERRNMETHAAPLRYFDGNTVQLAVTRDVTERKRQDRAALLLSAIVDSSDDAIVSKDLNGVITSWNKAAERLFGYTAAEAVGRPVAELIIPADRQEEEPQILSRLRRGERVDHFETKRQCKDGTLLDISLTISPVKDAKGTIIGASKIARNITESKRIQAALAASESQFRQLADAMPQIVWTAGPDGRVDYYNERWYEFTGFDRNTFGDISWEGILHPGDLQRCRATWYEAVKSGEPYNIEYRFFDRANQQWRWFVGRALPVRDESGTIVKWFGSCTDIDQQKRVQEDLRRANQDLEQFAFSASHDLQEPLRTVKIYSELLLKRHADALSGEAHKFLGFVHGAATRMELLIRDLLAYTHAAKIEAASEAIDSNEAFHSALADLAGLISETGAQITADHLPSVRVHSTHLQQLFQNLIGNAIKYRSRERTPEVHVAAERQQDEWIFSVRDNGIGIDPEYKENIFGLFRRLHSSDEYSGTGIGLAICRRIMDRYHGRIWVESEPGRGSVFRFSFPA